MKMYKTSNKLWGDLIEVVEVEKKTEKSVWVNGRVERKNTDYHSYFTCFDSAKAFLLDVANAKVEARKVMLDRARDDVRAVVSLRST